MGVKQLATVSKDRRGGDPSSSRMAITQSAGTRTRELLFSLRNLGSRPLKLVNTATKLCGVHRVPGQISL